MKGRTCVCDVFHDDKNACRAGPTQEDLLCDDCRAYDESVKTMWRHIKEGPPPGPPETTGVHASGTTSNGGRHHTWAAYTREAWAAFGVGDKVRVNPMG
jgi:hypothetical protein